MDGLGRWFTENAFIVRQVFGGEAAEDDLLKGNAFRNAFPHGVYGNPRSQLDGIAVDASADTRER